MLMYIPLDRFFLLAKFKRTFSTTPLPKGPTRHNVGVTLTPHFNGFSTQSDLVSKTDANILQVLDRVTLEPLAIHRYERILKELDGPLSAAHGGIEDGEFCNYVLSLGASPGESFILIG